MKNNEMSLEDIFLRLTDETFDSSTIERSLKLRKEAAKIADGNDTVEITDNDGLTTVSVLKNKEDEE